MFTLSPRIHDEIGRGLPRQGVNGGRREASPGGAKSVISGATKTPEVFEAVGLS
jgi:hypothetical protein